MTKSSTIDQNILKKLGIDRLNPMQQETIKTIANQSETVLLSPTGTGKTLAFLIPIIDRLDKNCSEVQVMILAPSRELALQIEQVARNIGSGFKINAVYGGRSGFQDKLDLKHRPAILIGTPGRMADHLRRERFSCEHIKTIVLDEFDKSLQIGFEADMIEIMDSLPNLQKRILTSATKMETIPPFVGLLNPITIDYLHQEIPQLQIKAIVSPEKDKLETLVKTLCHIGNEPGIIFCNFKDSIQRVSEHLHKNNISHGCFYGGMEQKERERALIKFRNGTYQIIIATDLAARGIDVPEIKFIIHYHLPLKLEEFTHRNGRTARMNSEGTAFVLKWENENLPDFMPELPVENLMEAPIPATPNWQTLYISGGRRDKISKGDIAGFFIKQGKINKDQLGIIELKQDCAYVAIPSNLSDLLVSKLNNGKLKKKKVRVIPI